MNTTDIKSAAPGDVIHDDVVKGLHLRALATKKTFYLYYRTRAGVERRPKLGDFGTFTLAQARDMARAILERVAQGQDPSADWVASKDAPTVNDLFDRVKVEKKWADETKPWPAEVRRMYGTVIGPIFGKLRVASITENDVETWYARLAKTPYQANRALSVLSRLMRRAERYRWRPQGTNPCAYVDRFTERKRSRFAHPHELAKLGPILEREATSHPRQVAFLYLLLFSGSRPQAIANATWTQLARVTVEGQVFGILEFDGKTTGATGEKERVYLPPQAMAVLDRLPVTTGPILGLKKVPRKFWHRVREEAGCPDLWARDFRRTFATVGLSAGHDKGVIGQLLNHRNASTTDIYAKLMDGTRREVAASTATAVAGLLTGPGDGV